MVQIGRESTGVKKWIATWAKGCGAERTRLAQFGKGGGVPFGYGCANSIVLSKIKEALGLDQSKGCFTAAAPISAETLLYFGSLDIPVYEVQYSTTSYLKWRDSVMFTIIHSFLLLGLRPI
jgi:long-chain-fatty-acid--CoA ligase ACSBG